MSTELTKKERGRKRYLKQQSRVADERKRTRRTRPSDISPKRITDGIPMVLPQGFQWIPRQHRALTLDELSLFVGLSEQMIHPTQQEKESEKQ